ncbi:MAG: hypothetical protein H6644_15715 [Caldilineaceae bacterium]|nr:hypothetical protein [Caldilineaceae bacterium]
MLTLNDVDVLAGRTGYTGEDGFELYFPADAAVQTGTTSGCGKDDGLLPRSRSRQPAVSRRACRSTATRLTPRPTPGRTLGLDRSWDKESIGRAALLKTKLEGRRACWWALRWWTKPWEASAGRGFGETVGHVTTGMKSPTLDTFLGMGYLPRGHTKVGPRSTSWCVTSRDGAS